MTIQKQTTTTAIIGISRYLAGTTPLPAGAVPLATEPDKIGSVVCLTPVGRWIRWWPGTRSIEHMPQATVKEVAEIVVQELGGTAQSAAEQLGVSKRTVESWRCGRGRMGIANAMQVAAHLALKEQR